VVRLDGHDVGEGELLLYRHAEGKVLLVELADQVGVAKRHHAPYPAPAGLGGRVGEEVLPPAEGLLAVSLPPSLGYGVLLDAGGEEEVVGVVEVDLVYHRMVRRSGYVSVGHPLGHPERAGSIVSHLPQRTGADDLEYPCFVRVRNGELLAAVAVAVLLGQAAHDQDGLAGRSSALKGQHG